MNITEAVAQARTDGDYQGVIDSIPYMKFLGLTVSSDENGPLVMMPGSDHIIGNPVLPAIHGGVVGAAMAIASGAQAFHFNGADNGSVSRLVILGESMRIKGFNDISHLR